MSPWLQLGLSLALLAFGLFGSLRPTQLARHGEQLDAIGSSRSLGSVEPADWYVSLTRIVSIGLSVFASVALVLTLLEFL